MLDDHGVKNYAKHTIVQSLDLKEKLEKCRLKQNEVTLMLIDIVNMYPLVRVKLIHKALNHYAKNLPATTRETIDLCMYIAQFGMKSTLIQFRGQYFVYQGAAKGKELSDKDAALAIGAYELAFLANIVGGIYRDNGLVMFVGNKNKREIQEWLWKYQSLVNKLVGGNCLQFTIKLWQPPPANVGNSPVKKDTKEMG
eukprot:14451789-Ditylum_brightwellii.AAC.1